MPEDVIRNDGAAPAPTVVDQLTENQIQDSAQVTPDATAEPAEEPRIAGFTEAEARALLEKASKVDQLEQLLATKVRDMDTKYGGVMSKLNQKQEPRKLTKAEFKKFSDMLGEDSAEALAEDLSGLLTAPVFNADELLAGIDSRLETKLAEREKALVEKIRVQEQQARQEEILDNDMPDWRDIATGREMALWESLQSQEKLNHIDEDFKTKPFAKVMKSIIKEFGDWKEARARRAAKDKELAETVNPKGTPSRSETTAKSLAEQAEEAAMEIRNSAYL